MKEKINILELDSIMNSYNDEILKKYFIFPEGVKSIYHYTDGNALIQILKNNTLRATNVQFMNDTEEVKYSFKRLSDLINTKRHNKSDEINKWILDFYNDHLLKNLKNNIERTFISSFSLDSDSLHLWNNYGKNDGYAIGFNFFQLMDSFEKKNICLKLNEVDLYKDFTFYFGKVLYDEKLQIAFLEYSIKSINEFLVKMYVAMISENNEEYTEIEKRRIVISQIMISGIFTMKMNPHKIEDEYRITIIPDRSFNNIKYISKNGIITPYLEYIGNLSIDSITIGPKIKDEISFEGINLYLKSLNKNEINIRKSIIGTREI